MIYGLLVFVVVKLAAFSFFLFFLINIFSPLSAPFPLILVLYSCSFFLSLKLQIFFFQPLLDPENFSPRLGGGGSDFERLSLEDLVGVLPNKECRAWLWQENRTYFLDGYNSLKKQISSTKNKNFTSAWFYRGQESVS